MTSVSIMSDLHLEFADITLPGGDILILAGDIWLARDMTTDGSANPDRRKRYVRFCQHELRKYARVLAITGNHESYGFCIDCQDKITPALYFSFESDFCNSSDVPLLNELICTKATFVPT